MLLKTRRANTFIMSEHIESVDSPYGYRPYVEVTMTSGAKHVIDPDELRKAFPDYH